MRDTASFCYTRELRVEAFLRRTSTFFGYPIPPDERRLPELGFTGPVSPSRILAAMAATVVVGLVNEEKPSPCA